MKKSVKRTIRVISIVLGFAIAAFVILALARTIYRGVYQKHVELYKYYSCAVKEYQKDTVQLLHLNSDDVVIIDTRKLKRYAREGDTSAFNKLKIIYGNWGLSNEIIDYALILANKYNYPPAYLCVYEEIVKFYGGDIEKCPPEAKRIALSYLEEFEKLCNNK